MTINKFTFCHRISFFHRYDMIWYIYTHLYIYIYICLYIYICIIHTYAQTHMQTYIHVHNFWRLDFVIISLLNLPYVLQYLKNILRYLWNDYLRILALFPLYVIIIEMHWSHLKILNHGTLTMEYCSTDKALSLQSKNLHTLLNCYFQIQECCILTLRYKF